MEERAHGQAVACIVKNASKKPAGDDTVSLRAVYRPTGKAFTSRQSWSLPLTDLARKGLAKVWSGPVKMMSPLTKAGSLPGRRHAITRYRALRDAARERNTFRKWSRTHGLLMKRILIGCSCLRRGREEAVLQSVLDTPISPCIVGLPTNRLSRRSAACAYL